MTKSETGLPLTICKSRPTGRLIRPFAVFELIDDLRDATWQRYNIQLIDEFRDQLKTNLANYSEKEPDDPGLVIRKEDSTKNGGPRRPPSSPPSAFRAVQTRVETAANTVRSVVAARPIR
jgi:hypothetical protein